MQFNDILDVFGEAAAKIGVPSLFGDANAVNIQMNKVQGPFMSLDVPNMTYDTSASLDGVYRCVLRFGDDSYLGRDQLRELNTLANCDLRLRNILSMFACHYEIPSIAVRKFQGEFDTMKSGWEAVFTIKGPRF